MNGYPRSSPWWRDGLVWSLVGVILLGVLVGIAVGKVLYG